MTYAEQTSHLPGPLQRDCARALARRPSDPRLITDCVCADVPLPLVSWLSGRPVADVKATARTTLARDRELAEQLGT